MKRIVLTLCIFIALSSLADARRHYKCVDSNGNILLTDNLPQGATCELIGGERDLTPSEAAAREIDRKTDEANRKIDRQTEAANDKIEVLINQLMNDPRNLVTQDMGRGVIKTGGLKQHVLEQIVELRKAQLRNQGSTPNGNQQDEMKRQQRELKAKKGAMEVKMRSQELEIQHLEREKRMSEHNQRMQQLRKDMGQ